MTENGNLPNTMSSFSVWSTVKTQFQNIKGSIVKYAKKETLDRIYNLVIERMSCGASHVYPELCSGEHLVKDEVRQTKTNKYLESVGNTT